MSASRFPDGCVASPHRTASEAGARVLAGGGNALDAAIATNLVLGVVAPHLCGYGGDLFAMVWDGEVGAYNGSGRAGAGADPASLPGPAMPDRGPASVTVPGAPAAWFALLDRYGSRSFGALAAPALALARDGFSASSGLARAASASAPEAGDAWRAIYGQVRAGQTLRQPDLARLLDVLVERGPDGYYRGPVAAAIADAAPWLTEGDLAAHAGDWVEPMRASFAGAEVLEMPPNTQGVTALQMLRITERALGGRGRAGGAAEAAARDHLAIEAASIALADRDRHVGDPATMTIDPGALIADEAVARAAASIDPARARPRAAAPDRGTAYLCAADRDGMIVSLIQSNFRGFGSLVTVPGWGINLHDRGAGFVLTPGHPNELAAGKRPLHTLIPAMLVRDGTPVMAFGTMGGHAQASIHLQLLVRMLWDGMDPQDAIDAPRWVFSHLDGSIAVEQGAGEAWAAALEARGHRVRTVRDGAEVFGHAHAIAAAPDGTGWIGGSDPRAEGAVLGP